MRIEMKKQYIVSLQGVHAPKLFSVEDRLKKFGEVEMVCHYRVETSVFKVSTEDPMCDAQKIKYAIKDLLNPLVEKASIYRVSDADCAETESVAATDNPGGFPYCFSRFRSVSEAQERYNQLMPQFYEKGNGGDTREWNMTFPEYLFGKYEDYMAGRINYQGYLWRLFSK